MKGRQENEDAKEVYSAEVFVRTFREMVKDILGEPRFGEKSGQGEVLIWCRKCSGHARQRMRPKWMHCCRAEPVGTKAHGKTLKGIQTLEDGRVPAKHAQN